MTRSFYISLFLSKLADQILLFLVPLVIYRLTGSVAWSGAAFFLETLPRYVAFPFCGILCDRVSPLRLLHLSQMLRAAAVFGGVAGHWAFGGIGWLIAISAICGVLTTQGVMSREVILPQMLRGQRFEKVLSYTQIADQLGSVLGPLAGAALLDVWAWELVVLFAGGLFLGADGAIHHWRRATNPALAPPETARANWFAPLAVAARHIWRLPGLGEVIVLAAGVNLVYGAMVATAAAMVVGTLGGTDSDFALLQAASAVASVAILLFVAHAPIRIEILGVAAFVLILAGGVLSGIAGTMPVYFAAYLLVMGFDKMFSVFMRTLRQRLIPPRDFGKTTGLVVMLNNLSQPLAGLIVAVFAAGFGLGAVLVAIAAAMGALGAVSAAMMRRRTKG
ncbi:MAG: MFS transporter [Rhodospirillales bacterium]|nr:MFS transporter [Rhodospirillales bacterium]